MRFSTIMISAIYAAPAMAAALPNPYPVPVPDSVRITSSDDDAHDVGEDGGEGVVGENQPDSIVNSSSSSSSSSVRITITKEKRNGKGKKRAVNEHENAFAGGGAPLPVPVLVEKRQDPRPSSEGTFDWTSFTTSDSSETFDSETIRSGSGSGSGSGFSSSECSYDCSGFGDEDGSAWDN